MAAQKRRLPHCPARPASLATLPQGEWLAVLCLVRRAYYAGLEESAKAAVRQRKKPALGEITVRNGVARSIERDFGNVYVLRAVEVADGQQQ